MKESDNTRCDQLHQRAVSFSNSLKQARQFIVIVSLVQACNHSLHCMSARAIPPPPDTRCLTDTELPNQLLAALTMTISQCSDVQKSAVTGSF